MNLKQYSLRECTLFIVGFCLYITIEVCWRGYSNPILGLVGGIALIYLDNINERLSWDIEIGIYGLLGSCFITSLEFIIGELIKVYNLTPLWDYSTMPLNFDGVICLPFSIAWFFLSIGGVFIADAINYYVFDEKPVPYYKLLGKTFLRFKEK